MTAELEPHPHHMVMFATVRAPASAIASANFSTRSLAIFSIMSEAGKSVRFNFDQCIFPYGHAAADIIDGLAATIPRGATVMAAIDEAHMDQAQRHTGGEHAQSSILDLLASVRPDLIVMSLNGSSADLDQVAAAYSLPRARPDASVEMRVNRLPVEVQCLWLLYVWAYCDENERKWLIAGWLAWRALRMARPSIPDLDERR